MAAEIPLSRGLFALVDDADVERLRIYKWSVIRGGNTFYARSYVGADTVMMHHLVMPPPTGLIVDHVNFNGLDNRRGNLRVCTHSQNRMNTRKPCKTVSRFKGVHLDPKANKWRVQINIDRDRISLGSFASEIRAALQYDRAARLLFGKFARTNEALGLLAGAEDRVLSGFDRLPRNCTSFEVPKAA